MSNAPLVFLEAYACTVENGGPFYATVRADEMLRARLLEMQALCKEHGLSEVHERRGCDWGPGDVENEMRLENQELVVYGEEFCFVAMPRIDVDYHVETRCLQIQAFVDATREHVSDVPLTFGEYDQEQWQEYLDDYAKATANNNEAAHGGMRP